MYIYLPSIALTTTDITLSPSQPYDKWLPTWKAHMTEMPDKIYVPLEATAVITPLVSSNWQTLLAEHPDQSLVKLFTSGIADGFRIGFHHPKESLQPAKKNMYCATQHPEVVDKYLAVEISHRRVVGPFTTQCSYQQIWCNTKTSSAQQVVPNS